MIERYTIKFGPAVSQKELEKALHEGALENADLHKMKVRIEFVGDFEDVKKVAEFVKRFKKPTSTSGPSAP